MAKISVVEQVSNEISEYDASHLRILEGRKHVRMRPAMFIGNTGSQGLHNVFLHILENAIEGVLAGQASDIYFTETPNTTIRTFANNIATDRGGTHLQGLQSGLRRAISSYARKSEELNEYAKYFRNHDVSNGIVAAVSIRHLTPWFEGATQARLGNEEVEGVVNRVVREAVGKFFAEHPDIARRIMEMAAERQRKRRTKTA